MKSSMIVYGFVIKKNDRKYSIFLVFIDPFPLSFSFLCRKESLFPGGNFGCDLFRRFGRVGWRSGGVFGPGGVGSRRRRRIRRRRLSRRRQLSFEEIGDGSGGGLGRLRHSAGTDRRQRVGVGGAGGRRTTSRRRLSSIRRRGWKIFGVGKRRRPAVISIVTLVSGTGGEIYI